MSRVIWITGGSAGIGRALAIHAAREGDIVAISARRETELNQVVAAYPERISAFPMDATDPEASARVVKQIESNLGPIDVAVLNAGTHQETPASAFAAADVQRLFALNLIGPSYGLEALLPGMISRQEGRIALVASVAGYRGLPRAAGYCATKAGLIALAEALKPELDAHGIAIQIVNPGFVRTPLTDQNEFPMPFLMEPDDAARRIWLGLQTNQFEIAFPRRFAWQLKLLQMMPYPLYFSAVKRFTGIGQDNG